VGWAIASLGAFEVFEVLGSGGMGVVRRAVHRPTGLNVAVKVLQESHDRDFVAAFRSEVRAVASLSHPGIITVLDHGEVPEHAETQSGGLLKGGNPFLVMELMPGGTLSRSRTYPWPALRSILMGLLDALAHAHARGVLHRDIKRGNVLLAHPDGPHRGLRLTDFGIAHVAGTTDEEGVFGSPSYMAPEQCLGSWREHGPWTDLYGVGCLAWSLATGAPPFAGSYAQLLEAHVVEDPPDFLPRQEVPPDFEDWLRLLLAKRPDDRPRYAAEAAALLRELGPVEPLPEGSVADSFDVFEGFEPEDADGASLSDRATRPVASVTRRFALGSHTATGRVPAVGMPLPTLVVPETWRRPRPPPAPMNLVGAGLGLYGLRPVPLVGREAERDVIWRTLQDTARDGRASFVLIRGAAGRGKSRLAEWIAERAHECGVGSVWKALHSPVAGPIDGLGAMLARKLSCVALEPDAIAARVERLLGDDGITDPYERDALVQLMAPRAERVRFTNPVEKHVVLRRALERDAARGGPVLLCLDDVQWGLDALAFAHHLLKWQRGSPSPIVVLATARSEALPEGSLEDLQLGELLRRDRTTQVELPPLGKAAHTELVGGLLGLSGTLAAEVRRRTDGNPLFATQLVGDWVRRGVLVPGPRGFVLEGDDAAEIPDDIHQVWVNRLGPLLDLAGRDAVELAAALGQNVDREEWRASAARADIDVPDDLVDRLAKEGLVRARPDGFEWIHGMLRESVERRSRERGSWPRWNRACAAMVEALDAGPDGPERLGLHLLAAGDHEAALHPLLIGARRLRRISEMPRGMRLLDRREEALEELGVPDTDERWGLGWAVRSVLFNALGRMEEARRWGEKAVDGGRAHGWGEALALGLQCAAWGPFWAGDLAGARAMLEEAMVLYESRDEPGAEAAVYLSMAYVALFSKDPAGARGYARRGEELHLKAGNRIGAVEAFRLRSTIERLDGNHEESMRVSREVIERNTVLGNRIGIAEGHNELAETARYLEQWALAETHYRAALAIYLERGSRIADIMYTNLTLLMLAQGRLIEAEAFLHRIPAKIDIQDSWLMACVVGLARMAVAAGRAAWDDWDREAEIVRGIASSGAAFDRDTLWTAEMAAGIAEDTGDPERAAEARELVKTLRERLVEDV